MPELPEGKSQLSCAVDAGPLEALKRLAKSEGKTQGELIAELVIAYEAVPEPIETGSAEVFSLPVPRDRDMLKDAFLNVVAKCSPFLHANYIMSALAMARNEYVRGLPEFKDAERMRTEWAARRAKAAHALEYTKKGAPLS